MPKCSFCGENIESGTGKLLILNTGKSLYFCSRKCEKNLRKLRRTPRRTKWTKAFAQEKTKGKK